MAFLIHKASEQFKEIGHPIYRNIHIYIYTHPYICVYMFMYTHIYIYVYSGISDFPQGLGAVQRDWPPKGGPSCQVPLVRPVMLLT